MFKRSPKTDYPARAKTRVDELFRIAHEVEASHITTLFKALASDGRRAGFSASRDCAAALKTLVSLGFSREQIEARVAVAIAARDKHEAEVAERSRRERLKAAEAAAAQAQEAAEAAQARAVEARRMAEVGAA